MYRTLTIVALFLAKASLQSRRVFTNARDLSGVQTQLAHIYFFQFIHWSFPVGNK